MIDSSFADLATYVDLPRVTGLALSPDGRRLAAAVSEVDDDRARYCSAIWEIPLGDGPPRRLTRSSQGESSPAWHPDGSLLFISSRPGSGAADDETALWQLPVVGEAEPVLAVPGGVAAPSVAERSGRVLLLSTGRLVAPLPGDAAPSDEAEARSIRSKRKVSAIVYTGMPIRHWDRELGVDSPRLLSWQPGGDATDVTPDADQELVEAERSISADGTTAVTTWTTRARHGRRRHGLAVLDLEHGTQRLWSQVDNEAFYCPTIAPDAHRVAVIHEVGGDYEHPFVTEVRLYDLDGTNPVTVDVGDLQPVELAWAPDSSLLFVAGDWHGRAPVLAIDPVAGKVVRRLASDGAYSALCPAPDGVLYALRSTPQDAPQPVRLNVAETDQAPVRLPTPAPTPALPGVLEEVSVELAGGFVHRGWLCRPADQMQPAPLMLWVHGGPFLSGNAWSWRWNPWLAVARGYAVLMPDPSLSTGYGREWIARAWPHRAGVVWADLEALLEVVIARDDIDAQRTACLGGSFGGYMTNWIAGHTDRFRAIVTHAGLWALDQQHATTDWADGKTRLFGTLAEHPDWYAENSPNRFVEQIRTPMLICHGNRDYRVPIGEALRLWWDLVSRFDGDPAELPHRFLNLTNENHWVLGPANAQIWYETVFEFCDTHVRG